MDLSFDAAAERLVAAHAADGEMRDLPITDLATWVVAPHEGQLSLVPLARHHPPLPLRSAAFTGLAAKLGAPGEFLRRMPAPLQLATLNYLLSREDTKSSTVLRVRGGQVSAIVSGRYAALDPEELVQTLRTALLKHGMLDEVRVRSVSSGLVDQLRMVFPAHQRAIKVGDISMVSLDVISSSFARSALAVVPGCLRLVCLNGLLRADRREGLHLRHTGDTGRLRDALTESIPSAMTRAHGVMDQWQRSVTYMLDDVVRQVDEMRDLTNPERKALEAELVRETNAPDLPERLPLYSFVNAITASAKQAAPARRLELEGLAGDVLARHVGRDA